MQLSFLLIGFEAWYPFTFSSAGVSFIENNWVAYLLVLVAIAFRECLLSWLGMRVPSNSSAGSHGVALV